MRFSQAWMVARHDMGLYRARRGIFIALFAFPVGVAIGFPVLVGYIISQSQGGPGFANYLPNLVDAFGFWFVIAAASLPTAMASYGIVGEKMEKSLEPLLSTPTTDGEILLGKVLAAFVPTVLAIWGASVLYMGLMDWEVRGVLGHLYLPNGQMAMILLLLAPLACLYAIEVSILVSSRVSDVRSAQQYAGLVFLPLIFLYLAGEIGKLTLDTTNLGRISAALAAIVLALFFASTRTFQREEILTRWK